jgi:hypothetical protein
VETEVVVDVEVVVVVLGVSVTKLVVVLGDGV